MLGRRLHLVLEEHFYLNRTIPARLMSNDVKNTPHLNGSTGLVPDLS